MACRGQALQRFGYALTGDWALAEDLLQTALARAYPRWSRVQRDNPEAYVRKIMLNTWSSWWRRRWRGELPTGRLPDAAGPDSYQATIPAAWITPGSATLSVQTSGLTSWRYGLGTEG